MSLKERLSIICKQSAGLRQHQRRFTLLGVRWALPLIIGTALVLLTVIPLRAIDPDDIIITIGGTGNAGYNGDVISAPIADLNAPSGIVVLPSGEIIIADTTNHRIRQIRVHAILILPPGNR